VARPATMELRMSASANNSGPSHDAHGPPGRDGKPASPGAHLPPPAFPPGRRRIQLRRRLEAAEAEPSAFDDALISPDDPIPERSRNFEGAFISPDDPMPERAAAHERAPEARADADEDVLVTGIGSDAHLDPSELALGGDPHVGEVAEAVARLAAALQRRGESGLRTTPEMTRFEAQLRSYCVGYLAGRRAEDEEA
jgi:hypothetical protein